jgi:diguanylate cyclase (GGDEF)-like protein
LNIENFAFRVRSGQERRKSRRDSDRRTKNNRRTTRETDSGMLSVTVSIGLAECQPKFNVEEVIQQADKALYRAKQGGRNRLETAVIVRKRLGTRKAKPKKVGLS